MAGPPGSGKGTQAGKIVQDYKCVHISIGDLVRNALNVEDEWSRKAKPIVDSGKYLPQHMINPLLKNRLEQKDCKEFGWILDSYPRIFYLFNSEILGGKENQEFLSSLGEEPNLIFFLDISLKDSVERQSGRVKDPVTGEVYHLKYKPPPIEEIKNRCEQRSTDNAEKAKIRYESYNKSGWNSAKHYTHYYPDVSVHSLDATDSEDTIYAHIKDEIKKLML